jgi:hypothetical protein
MNSRTLVRLIIGSALILCLVPGLLPGQNYGPSLGIILGSPTGFTFKYVFARTSAIAINAGWGLVGAVHFSSSCDYQFLFPQTMRWTDEFEGTSHELKGLTPYFGVGGRFSIEEEPEPSNETKLHAGVRIGGGVEYAINRFGIFLEIYPVVDIIPGTEFDIMGGLGFRFYFAGHQ